MNLKNPFISAKSGHAMRDARKEAFFSELHSLLGSGLDFSRSFELLIGGERDDKTRELIERLYRTVVRGESLWTSFERSKGFAPLDYGVLRIGEETGRLNDALAFLADYYHKKAEQRRMVSSAVSYPLIILFTAVVVVVFMVLVIVPMFEQVYSRMGGELPGLTRQIIALSKSFPALLTAAMLAAGTVLLLWKSFGSRPAVQRVVSETLLRTPLLGGILRKNYQARFCKLLYLLSASGVPLLRGIGMLEGIITFYPYRQSFVSIARGLRHGGSLSSEIGRGSRLYDPKLVTLIRVGEETGRLPDMLRKQGDDLTRELEFRLKSLGSLLEPALILLVGILVAVILVSMYLPMFRLGGIMG